MAGRQCAQEGCRAWARRGRRYCQAHGRPAAAEPADDEAGAPGADQARTQGQQTASELAALERVVQDLTTGQATDLAGEIAAARLALVRLLREEADPVRLADGVAKAAGVVLKAHQLEGQPSGAGDDLTGIGTDVLEEMGLGASNEHRAMSNGQ